VYSLVLDAGTVSVSVEPRSMTLPGKSPVANQLNPDMHPAAKYRKLELSANRGQQQHETVSRVPVTSRNGGPVVFLSAATGKMADESMKMPKSNVVRKQTIPKTDDETNGRKKKQTSSTPIFEKDPVKQQSAARKHDKAATSASLMTAASNAARKRKASLGDEDEPPELILSVRLQRSYWSICVILSSSISSWRGACTFILILPNLDLSPRRVG